MPVVSVRICALATLAILVAGCAPRPVPPSPAARSLPTAARGGAGMRRMAASSHPAAVVGSWRLVDLKLTNASPAQEKRRRAFLDRSKTVYTFAKDGSASSVSVPRPPTRAVWDADASELRILQEVVDRKSRRRNAEIIYRYQVEERGRRLNLTAPNGGATLVFRKE